LEPKPPGRTWYCTKCGSEKVLSVSGLDAKERYAIAAHCNGCHKDRVIVQRVVVPPKVSPKGERKG
jgi:hypothetical protein